MLDSLEASREHNLCALVSETTMISWAQHSKSRSLDVMEVSPTTFISTRALNSGVGHQLVNKKGKK